MLAGRNAFVGHLQTHLDCSSRSLLRCSTLVSAAATSWARDPSIPADSKATANENTINYWTISTCHRNNALHDAQQLSNPLGCFCAAVDRTCHAPEQPRLSLRQLLLQLAQPGRSCCCLAAPACLCCCQLLLVAAQGVVQLLHLRTRTAETSMLGIGASHTDHVAVPTCKHLRQMYVLSL